MLVLLIPSSCKSLLSDQFALSPTASTAAAFVQLFCYVSRILETNYYVKCFLIYFGRSLDSVSRSTLLDKLLMLDCPQVVISCQVNFHTDKTHRFVFFFW